MDEYETIGDPDRPFVPTKRDGRAQEHAVALREAAGRSHFHQFTAGESVGSYFSHSHEDDDEGHQHPPRQAFPARADGGYVEESGPSLGRALPAPVAANAARVLEMVSRWPATPSHQLVRWRLRLYCGHVVERTAHAENRTVHAAFMGSVECPECGLDPSTIVAAKPVGRAAEPPASPRPPDRRAGLERKLARAQAEVERLRAELESCRER